jgi:hypothetical protein
MSFFVRRVTGEAIANQLRWIGGGEDGNVLCSGYYRKNERTVREPRATPPDRWGASSVNE